MNALYFHDNLQFINNYPTPVPSGNEVLIRIVSAGICNTDIEITRGYVPGFNGIPGHEFFGFIERTGDSSLHHLIGKRVTAEINCGCGECSLCQQGMERHCRNRTVIGIIGRDGAFAEFINVPVANVVVIPDSIQDNNALFIEPLAAALEIQEQISIGPEQRVLVIGDGKLAYLIALTLMAKGCLLHVSGKHDWKIDLIKKAGIEVRSGLSSFDDASYDIVIEASGSRHAFNEGLAKVKPRGTIVLKSTYADSFSFNPSFSVVNEITMIGSRCGRFSDAIEFLITGEMDLSGLISGRFSLSEGVAAFKAAQAPDTMKIVIDCT